MLSPGSPAPAPAPPVTCGDATGSSVSAGSPRRTGQWSTVETAGSDGGHSGHGTHEFRFNAACNWRSNRGAFRHKTWAVVVVTSGTQRCSCFKK